MKKELKILLTAYCFSTFAFSMLSPIYAIFVEEIGGGILEASYAIAIFTFISGLLIMLFSRFGDNVRHQEKLISAGYLINAAGFFMYAFVTKPVHLYVVEILFGIGIAILSPVFDGLYSKYLDRGKYISEWGDWEALGYMISSLSALFGGALASMFGFKTLFFTMAGLSLVAMFVSLTLKEPKSKKIKLTKLLKK